jgi:hypothetical protein
MPKVDEKVFCRLRRSCRSAALARIGKIAGAADASGWPDRVRYTILLRSKGGGSARGGQWKGVSSSRSTSTVLHSPACPTSLGGESKTSPGAKTLQSFDLHIPMHQGRSDKRGCEGRLRSARGRNSLATAAEGGDSSLRLAAKWCTESYRGSQHCPQRRRSSLYETAMPIGTKNITEKNLQLHCQFSDASKPAECATHSWKWVASN